MLGLIDMNAIKTIWGHSSVGRAPAWHAGGQRFESAWLHLNLVGYINYAQINIYRDIKFK